MTFTRFVEAGRVALINYGPHLNKLVVIVDIVDQSRVLIDGPSTNLRRQMINLKRLSLTSIKIDGISRGAPVEQVKKGYVDADVDATFAVSGWGKKLARKEKRRQLDDFGRFKVMCARISKGKKVRAKLETLKSAAA